MRYALLPWEADQELRRLRARHPFSVTSWWRSPERNRRVGGSESSKHLVGAAVDLVLENQSDEARRRFLTEARRRFWVQDEGGHIHLQWLPPGPIRKFTWIYSVSPVVQLDDV